MNMDITTLSFGQRLTSPDERMSTISLADLYRMITQSGSPIERQQTMLRNVMRIDMAKYRNMKKALPYFVCGTFAAGIRRIEHFSSASAFVLDIDHYGDESRSLQDLKYRLADDVRVAMVYTSPSGCGLKVLFLLDKPCYDNNVYSAFYKRFALEFAKEYDISEYVDCTTNDVARACFLAYDADCKINMMPKPINMDDYINTESVDLFFGEDRKTTEACVEVAAQAEAPVRSIDPERETLERIKAVLATARKKKAESNVGMEMVPQMIRDAVSGLKESVEELGVELYDTKAIQYGVKLFFRTNTMLSEINLFYGKNGYSVVMSPKKGTSAELNALMSDYVNCYLAGGTA